MEMRQARVELNPIATRQKPRGLMVLIVRPRVLHVTTGLFQSTLHHVTENERSRSESD